MMDMSQYLDTFLEEAKEHLQKLEQCLLNLEANPDNKKILDEIFRSAHTLKGMSATMGYNNIAELTHEMENVLHKVRGSKINSSPEIIDLLFKCVDSLNTLVCDIANGGTGVIPIDELLNELRSGQTTENIEHSPEPEIISAEIIPDETISSSVTSINFNQYEKNLITKAVNQGYNCYHLVVHINPHCTMKSARAFMIFKNLELVGEIIKSIPEVHDIEDERFETSFELIIISGEQPDVIRASLSSLTEVEEPQITCLSQIIHILPGEIQVEDESSQVPQNLLVQDDDNNEKITENRTLPNNTVRVDKSKLDNLMNLVGELVISKTRLERIYRQNLISELGETLEQIDRTALDLQDVAMKIRMTPIDYVFSRFPRMVRDLAKDLGKEIEFLINGSDTELDRTVMDEIGDLLVHLLRNAVDHGIEQPEIRLASGKNKQGRVILSAGYEGNSVVIEVEDDGTGMDLEVIKGTAVGKGLISREEADQLDGHSLMKLVLMPGFTTSGSVTGISGRGVGLDVVRSKTEALNGSIQIQSSPEKGTKFRIQLPLTLAIIQALLVEVAQEIYAIPLSFIAETTSVLPNEIDKIQDKEYMFLRGVVLPLKRLNEVFMAPEACIQTEPEINIVVVKKGSKMVGLIVDRLIGQQEIVIKPLSKLFGNIPVFAGATILGNGEVSMIIDASGLL